MSRVQGDGAARQKLSPEDMLEAAAVGSRGQDIVSDDQNHYSVSCFRTRFYDYSTLRYHFVSSTSSFSHRLFSSCVAHFFWLLIFWLLIFLTDGCENRLECTRSRDRSNSINCEFKKWLGDLLCLDDLMLLQDSRCQIFSKLRWMPLFTWLHWGPTRPISLLCFLMNKRMIDRIGCQTSPDTFLTLGADVQ